jgi:2-polyprenyl-3-methyl-5-hydroxy-6-metoxy-1,4-benzoquinol methylase
MGLKEVIIPAQTNWDKLRPIFRHHLWRHRIPLGMDGVVTPGYLMMKNEWSACFLPDSLEGLSFLDAGANDGYFSFEAERRGATEVVAADIYRETDFFSHTSGWPETGILLVKEVLHSNIQVVNCSILNLHTLGKTFDFVFCNNVLAWIRDVPEAIHQLTGICKGTLLLSDVFNEEIPTHITRSKFSANTLSIKHLKAQFNELGWEIYRIESRDEYQRLLWHSGSFDTVDSDGPVNCYADPTDKAPISQSTLHEARALMSINGRIFVNKVGWINEQDVRKRAEHIQPWTRIYRSVRFRSGLDRILFRIRNKNKDQGLFLFARKKQG